MYGWAGTILRIDLTSGSVKKEALDMELAKKYFGGRGLGVKYMYDEVDPKVEPLGPDNKLIFAAGPLNGTNVPRTNATEFDIGADEYDPVPEQPNFKFEVLNPYMLIENDERPVFQFHLEPVAGFDKPVFFRLAETNVSHKFSSDSVTPPGTAFLFLERPNTIVGSATATFHVIATDITGYLSKQVSVSYEVFAQENRKSRLSLWTRRQSIRLGDSTLIHGKLLPTVPSAPVTLFIASVTDDGSPTEVLSVDRLTDSKGRFQYAFTPEQTGTYSFYAEWGGNLSTDAAQSTAITVQVVSRKSKISLKVDLQEFPQVGDTLTCSGNLTPFVEGESATAEIFVGYNVEKGAASTSDVYNVNISNASYAHTITMKESGIVSIVTRWFGNPPSVLGAESPPIVLPVLPVGASQAEIQALSSQFDPGACVIVAGATSANLGATTRDYLSNLSYSVLRNRRFNDKRLEYMNNDPNQDTNWDQQDDPVVDIDKSSVQALQQAISNAAGLVQQGQPVALFIVAESGSGNSLEMADGSTINASEMNSLLNSNFGTTRDLRVLVEASNSGSFCESLKAANRTIICSASEEQASYFSGGLLSFAQLFATQVQAGWNIGDSFDYARDYIQATFGYYGAQTPWLIQSASYESELQYYGISSDATDMLPPDIEGVFEPIVLEETPEAEIYAIATDDTELYQVQAVVTKPSGETLSVVLKEQPVGSRKYCHHFDAMTLNQLGIYDVSFVAIDKYRNASGPGNSQILLHSAADLNTDHSVDAKDLYILMQELGKPTSLYDIVEDGRLDYQDILALTKNWQR